MSRFEDKPTWRFAEKMIGPAVAAFLTGAGLWATMQSRITAVEVKQYDMQEDVHEMKRDIKEILKRVR